MSSKCFIVLLAAAVSAAVSCMTGKRISEIERVAEGVEMGMVIPQTPPPYRDVNTVDITDTVPMKKAGPLIMNAVRDSETGEMTATDVIMPSKVTARFRNVAERLGKVEIQFEITVPQALVRSDLQLKFNPYMILYVRRHRPESDSYDTVAVDSVRLDPVYITGERYRQRQLRGYERYEAFLQSIVTDSTEFIRENQLEQFIRRYFPDTYAMKTDTSVVYDNEAANLFGVSVKTAVEHYTNHLMKARNERKMQNRDRMFRKFVKDPIRTEKTRLDTVMSSSEGNLVYRYVQTVNAIPRMNRITVELEGLVYRDGEMLCRMPDIDSLVFYISSLSSMADDRPRYIFRILERRVTDHTNAYIEFGKGSAVFDTLAPNNASELKRIWKSFADVGANEDLVTDSVVVTASCSLEGNYGYNGKLAMKRSESVLGYFSGAMEEDIAGRLKSSCIPENWAYFRTLVQNDTVLSGIVKDRIVRLAELDDKDAAEAELGKLPEYRYIREKIYPKLRIVRFEFHLHRKNMVKDTVHTTEIDSVYMRGVMALKNLDYRTAATLLKPYGDYNGALAMASAGYDESALEILRTLDKENPKVSYLTALVLSRMGRYREASESYGKSVASDPAMRHRANLDPEMSAVLKYRINNNLN